MKELRKVIAHLQKCVDNCDCKWCEMQESKSFIYGLRVALLMIVTEKK